MKEEFKTQKQPKKKMNKKIFIARYHYFTLSYAYILSFFFCPSSAGQGCIFPNF